MPFFDEMSTYEIVCQIIGIIAMVLSVASFQMKTKKQIILMQIATGVVFAVHYFMLPGGKGLAGAVVNVIAIVRNLVFMNRDKKFFSGYGWVVLFCVIMGGSAVVVRPEPISVFMTVAMVFNTLAVAAETPVGTRKRILISSPFAFVYNIVVGSWGGIINEAMVEIITAITLIREYKTKKRV